MKKTLSLLPVACLALLLTACGSREIPDDALEDLLGVEALFTDRLAGITSVSDITHQPGEDGDTVTATVVSDNGFTVYTDQCTALAVYDEEKQNWVFSWLIWTILSFHGCWIRSIILTTASIIISATAMARLSIIRAGYRSATESAVRTAPRRRDTEMASMTRPLREKPGKSW